MALQLPTLLTLLLLLTTLSTSSSAAPSPSGDCSTAVLSLADCLSYVTAGSTTKKPEGNCCSGLAKVVKTNAPCLCEAFKNSAQFGVSLNITKAMTLPQACKLSNTPSISNCAISNVGAPALSPTVAPPISVAPTTSGGAHDLAPAPAPSAASYALSAPAALLVLGLVFSYSLF